MHSLQTKSLKAVNDLLIVVGASILLALSAWISIRLPFTPVPISFTAQLVLLLSVLMGRKGTYATFLYFGQGLAGLPVFANGGAGLAYILGPTGGYLIGFMIASFIVGTISERIQEKSPTKTFLLMTFGNVLMYVFGLPHLALLVGGTNALKYGLYPFIGPDIFKLMFAQQALRKLNFFK